LQTERSFLRSLRLGSGLLNHRSGAGDVTAGYVVASAEQLREHADRVADQLLALASRRTLESAGSGTDEALEILA